MTNLTAWVLLMPLLGFIILGLTGRVMSRTLILVVALGACGLAFFFAAISFFSMLATTPVSARFSDQVLYTWVSSGVTTGANPLTISFGLLFDPLSAIMLMIVTGVGFLIHVYSAGYMEDDPGFWRYFAYLNFFIFAMVLLVSAHNFYTNGNGSIGVFNQVPGGGVTTLTVTIICLLLFLACTAKSAQLPLYMWLPDAMEGPTPVSALIHAATMVTAGVYLVARANPLFEVSTRSLVVVGIIGTATAFFAATIAVFQLDIKRVLAYSTISQLGYMFMGESVHNYSGGIFHLTTHAYFKALLFLGAGAVIHALGGEQDMREMGGLRKRLPITFWTFLIATLAISGIPPPSGFWSKDDILSSLLAGSSLDYILWGMGIVTAGLTAFYMFRLFFGIFMGDYRGTGPASNGHGDEEEAEEDEQLARSRGQGFYNIHEAPPVMTIPLIILAVLTAIGGLVGSFSIIGIPSWQPLANFLAPVFSGVHANEPSFIRQLISTGVSVFAALVGIAVAWRLYGKGFQYKENYDRVYQLVFHKYYVDEILTAIIIRPLLGFGRAAARLIEGDALDGGSRGVAWLLRGASAALRRLQSGYMRNYALVILVGVVLITVYYAVWR